MPLNQSQINDMIQKMFNLYPIARTVNISGDTSISFVAASDEIQSGTTDFVVEGVKEGMFITVSGSSANSGIHKVNSVAAGAVGVDSSLTDEIAGPAIDIHDDQDILNKVISNAENRGNFVDQTEANRTALKMFNKS